jgi:perosamine synthetase
MIPYGRHHIDEEDIQAVVDVLRGPALTQGPRIEEFERAIASYVGVKYAVAVSSGTAALHLATIAAGVGPGRSLITSPMTFVATANAALFAGGRPVFTDIDPDTVNMCPSGLAEALGRNLDARAVIPVHFAGLPCDMPAIAEATAQAGAVVIEDAAHALGSSYRDGSSVGSCAHSLMTIFSFHPVKAIAAGEGGMITTNDEPTHRRLLRLRSHGINKLDDSYRLPAEAKTSGVRNLWYYEMQELGFNYRLTDIQCALALSQLKKLDGFVARRRELTGAYDSAFEGFQNCRPAQVAGRDESAHHLYVLLIDFGSIGMTRAQLMYELRARDIGNQVHYIPVPAHPYYRELGFKPEDYPEASRYYEQALSIPLFFDLTSDEQNRVIAALGELVG